MSAPLSVRLRSNLRELGWRLGIDIRRFRPDATMETRRNIILARQNVGLVLDVGANIGQYGTIIRANGYRGKIISFEPLSQAFDQLRIKVSNDSQWDCHRLAIGDVDGSMEINVASNSASSSFLKMNTKHLSTAPKSKYSGIEPVTVSRLDGFMQSVGRECDPILLKADTQGYELQVLRGSQGIFDRISVVEAELSLIELYEGQALYLEVIDFLASEGFRLVGVNPGFSDSSSGEMLQMDGLFVRSTT